MLKKLWESVKNTGESVENCQKIVKKVILGTYWSNQPRYFLWNKFFFIVCLFWPSFCCLIHFILRTYYSNQSRYFLWKKFFVQSFSILTKLLLIDLPYYKNLSFKLAKISPLKYYFSSLYNAIELFITVFVTVTKN